jgi:INO80 complex subunit C
MKSVIGQEKNINIKAGERDKLTFKNPNFSSKFRIKDKNSRIAKNVKNMVQDTLDSVSYNLCTKLFNSLLDQSIEAGPSLLPKRKYCDITGFESNYKDPSTGLRYYNSEIYKIVGTLTEPIKNQYLALRKALFIIK